MLLGTIVGAYYLRKDVRGGLATLASGLQQYAKATLATAIVLAQRGITMLSN